MSEPEVKDVWYWLMRAAQETPACIDRVAALIALRAEDPEQAELRANETLTALWAAL